MTDSETGSTVPRRSLGIALRGARTAAGLTVKQAADFAGYSTQTVWRIENGLTPCRRGVVEALCTGYRVDDKTREALVGLAQETRSRGWWHSYGDAVPAWFELYVALEQTAAHVRMFDPLLVSGLLQHPDYMRAAVRAVEPELSDEQVTARIKLKLSRQELLTRGFPEAPRLDVILAEAVVLAEPRPEGVMRAQVWDLLKATELANVTVRVVPLVEGLHRASVTGAFTLLEFRTDNSYTPPPTVYSESRTGAIYLDRPKEVAAYEQVWAGLEAACLDQAETVEFLSRKLKELNDRER